MKFRPLNDKVVIRRIAKEATSPGGIVIPDKAQEKVNEGDVIAVGSGKRLEDGSRQPPDVKPGDRVIFGKFQGTGTKIDGKMYLIIPEDDIFGVLEEL